ncbi:P-loop containing nucleoside triphosphate hydrolase protein [Mycena sanguinolenta]|nr:P-loop containing nucleoside triphosphate hydrolase protein [Mycena sanguinolenta]
MFSASFSNTSAPQPSREEGETRGDAIESQALKFSPMLAPSRPGISGQDRTPGVVNTYNYYTSISGGQGGTGGQGGIHGGSGGTGEGPTVHLYQYHPSAAGMQASQVFLNHCPPPSGIFQGRQTILEAMYQFYAQDTRKQKIYVLYGLGGAGKTQIALKFIQDSISFTNEFLVDASSTETIETGLKNISVAKKAGNSPQDALIWLAGKHEEWLLFFDNADDPAINLSRFFAKCSHGNIIITTRNPGLRAYGAHSQVSDMEESDAVALLLQRACQKPSHTNESLASEIVKELAYLPLAIIQAGAYISESGALDTFLDLYRENRTELLKTKPAQGHDDYTWTVYTTWQMSFDKLSKPAAIFLLLCSFLHRDGITEDIFSRAATQLIRESSHAQSTPQRLSSERHQLHSLSDQKIANASDFLSHFLGPTGKWESFRFMQIINKIRAYSLINFNAEGKSFSIHPLVHNWSRTIIDNPEPYAQCLNDILGMSSSEVAAKDQELESLRLVSHVHFFMQTAPNTEVKFYLDYANIYRWAGQYTSAMELDVMTLKHRRKHLGDDHLDTLNAMQNLAITYQKLGQYDKAKQLEVVVLDKRRKLHGEDPLHTVVAVNNLAVTYRSLGQYDKAEQLQVVVLEERRKLLGDEHLETLQAMYNLALTYGNLGQYDKAEQLEVVALEKWRKLLGDDHLGTLKAMNNLGWTYCCQGQFARAENLLVVAVDKTRRLLGDDHPATQNFIDSLLRAYRGLDKHAEAADLEKLIIHESRGA